MKQVADFGSLFPESRLTTIHLIFDAQDVC